MNLSRRLPFNSHRQRGAVLFVALVFLILITLLALTATGNSILQEKMTGGMRNRQLGLMGAETGTRGGEAFLLNLNYVGANQLTQCPPSGATSTCAYVPRADTGSGTQKIFLEPNVQTFRTSTSWVASAPGGAPAYPHPLTGLSGDLETASLHEEPLLLVEALGDDIGGAGFRQSEARDSARKGTGAPTLYRITARSQGGSGAVVRVVESVYSAGLNIGNAGANPDDAP